MTIGAVNATKYVTHQSIFLPEEVMFIHKLKVPLDVTQNHRIHLKRYSQNHLTSKEFKTKKKKKEKKASFMYRQVKLSS